MVDLKAVFECHVTARKFGFEVRAFIEFSFLFNKSMLIRSGATHFKAEFAVTGHSKTALRSTI